MEFSLVASSRDMIRVGHSPISNSIPMSLLEPLLALVDLSTTEQLRTFLLESAIRYGVFLYLIHFLLAVIIVWIFLLQC